MEFGNTYIFLFGFQMFEPIVILSNLLIFLVSLYCFKKLNVIASIYAKQTALFILLMGVSTCFASIDHTIHYQLGIPFFRIILFISHTLNILALYYCFRASYTFFLKNSQPNKAILIATISMTIVLIILALLTGSFLTIKIPAAVVLIYALIIHYTAYRKNIAGSGLFAVGVLISFSSIIVHTLRLAINDWFNHKDIAHVIIAVSLIFMCAAVKINSANSTVNI